MCAYNSFYAARLNIKALTIDNLCLLNKKILVFLNGKDIDGLKPFSVLVKRIFIISMRIFYNSTSDYAIGTARAL